MAEVQDWLLSRVHNSCHFSKLFSRWSNQTDDLTVPVRLSTVQDNLCYFWDASLAYCLKNNTHKKFQPKGGWGQWKSIATATSSCMCNTFAETLFQRVSNHKHGCPDPSEITACVRRWSPTGKALSNSSVPVGRHPGQKMAYSTTAKAIFSGCEGFCHLFPRHYTRRLHVGGMNE